MEDDSFMQIVRERLRKHDFLEAQGKEGLFFNKWIVEGETFYVDMRKTPMRMYGYKDQGEGRQDTALAQDYVNNMLQDIKRELVSIGCDLKQHGFDQLPEPKPKEKPETVIKIIKHEITIEELEKIAKDAKEIFDEEPSIADVVETIITEHGNIELTIPRPEKKKPGGQRTVDQDFF